MRYYLLLLISVFSVCSVSAQKIAVKTNLLYDATETVNVGLELALGQRTTLDLSANYKGWDTDESTNKKMRHALVQPEFRYYFCEKYNRHFIGVHAIFTEYNVSGDYWYLSALKNASSISGVSDGVSRYEGSGVGAGLAYGYNMFLSNRLNLEFSVGAGYVHLDYDRYGPSKCSLYIESGKQDYLGITKLGLSLVYIIK